jgi:prepilin-type N-terminal cleavage/methylation domain-containing protein
MNAIHNRAQAGFSLIELMIAILLGIVLSFAAANLFLQAKVSYLEDEEYARLQENGRYALRLVGRELSMAGFLGGVFRGENISTALSGSTCYDYLMDTDVPFEHHNDVTVNGVGVPNEPVMPSTCLTSTAGDHQAGTDMLVARRTADLPHVVEGTVQAGMTIEDADLYLRKEEYNESLTLVTGTQTNHGGLNVDVWQYHPQMLFVRDWSRANTDGIPALCRKRLPTMNTECLVEGVENLQVEFGVDDDGDLQVDRFVDSPSSTNMDSVLAARIYLLMRSVNEVAGYTNDRAYTLGSTAVAAANDGFYRRVFQTTVLLRNSKVYKF